jgi:hypothetical protein
MVALCLCVMQSHNSVETRSHIDEIEHDAKIVCYHFEPDADV